MPIRYHRFVAVVLLPLFLWLLSGWTGPGGWYCAGGRRCEPPLAATCCCGDPAAAGTEERCPEGEACTPPVLSSLPCDCYYQSQVVDAGLEASRVRTFYPVAAFPSPAFRIYAPPPGLVSFSRPAALRGPPRLLVSSRVTRGPPAA